MAGANRNVSSWIFDHLFAQVRQSSKGGSSSYELGRQTAPLPQPLLRGSVSSEMDVHCKR